MRDHLIFVASASFLSAHCVGDFGHFSPTTVSTTEGSTSSGETSSTETPTTGLSVTDTSSGAGSSDTSMGSDQHDYEGEHVVVIADSTLELCGGTMAHMDDFVEHMARRLGVSAPVLGERIRFTWVRTIKEVSDFCTFKNGLGCAKSNQVFSIFAPHNHEIVHALSFGVGHPTPFFVEGMAGAHQGYDGLPLPQHIFTDSDVAIPDLVTASIEELVDVDDGYEKASRFTIYLIEKYGLESYRQAYAAIGAGDQIEDIDKAFTDVLNASFLESLSGFSSPWTTLNFDPQLTECDARKIPWDGEFLEMDGTVYCPWDDAIGPYDGSRVETHYTIDIPVDGKYALRIIGNEEEATEGIDVPYLDYNPPFIGVSILPCGINKTGVMGTQVYGKPRLAELRAGLHSLRLLGGSSMIWPFTFTLERLPDSP